MDPRDKLRRPVVGIGEPVYSTPNSSVRPSQVQSPPASATSPTIKPVNLDLTLINNISGDDLKNILAAAKTAHLQSPSHSSDSLSSDPATLTRKLTELIHREEDISRRRKELENQLFELRSQENDLFNQRSILIRQLEKSISSQSISTTPIKAPAPSISSSVARPTTIIESVDPEPNQFHPAVRNESNTPFMTKKKPGPASKTGVIGSRLSSLSASSTSVSSSKPNSAKKPRLEGDDNNKRPPITSGIKQSRPQPMRARKRTKPSDPPPPESTPKEPTVTVQPPQAVRDQLVKEKSIPEKQKSNAPPPQQKSDPPKDNPKTPLSKVAVPPMPPIKIKQEGEPKKRASNIDKNNDAVRISNVDKNNDAISAANDDKNDDAIRSDSTAGDSNDDACSDSDIFTHLGNIKPEPGSPSVNENQKTQVPKIKTEPNDK